MRETEPDRVDDAAAIQLVEVGHVAAPGPMPADDRVVEGAAPGGHRLAGSDGSSMLCRPSAMRMSFSWVMPAMPSPSVRMKYRLVCDDGVHALRTACRSARTAAAADGSAGRGSPP